MKKQKTLVVFATRGGVFQQCEIFGNKEEVQVHIIDQDEVNSNDNQIYDRYPALGMKFSEENFRRFIAAVDAIWPNAVVKVPNSVLANKLNSWHQAFKFFAANYWFPGERREFIKKWLGPYLAIEEDTHGSELEKAEVHLGS